MNAFVRSHSLAVSTVLSIVALGLVFGAVLGLLPVDALPRASEEFLHLIPTINAALSIAALGTISLGWRWARTYEIQRHRVAMSVSTILFALFLTLYLYRIALVGTTSFPGPAVVESYVYLPVLAIHVLLAIVCVPLVIYALVLATVHPVTELGNTNHPRIGRIAAPLWLVSFALGVVVYLLLYVVY